MQAGIQLFWKHFVKWVIVISVIRWARVSDRIAAIQQSLAADGAIACFSSSFLLRGWMLIARRS